LHYLTEQAKSPVKWVHDKLESFTASQVDLEYEANTIVEQVINAHALP